MVLRERQTSKLIIMSRSKWQIYNVVGRLTLDCWIWDKSEPKKLVTFLNGSNKKKNFKKPEVEEKWEEENDFNGFHGDDERFAEEDGANVVVDDDDDDDDDVNNQCAAPLVSTEVP